VAPSKIGALRYDPKAPILDGATETVFGNAGKILQKRMIRKDSLVGKAYGLSDEESMAAAMAGNPRAQQVADLSRSLGRGVQNLENFGKTVEKMGATPVSAALKTAKYGGYVMGKSGSALRAAGTVMQPVENRMLSRYGSEELYDYMRPKSPWQKRHDQSTMEPVLASHDL